MKATGPLLLVGCGKMGSALLSGWLTNDVAAQDIYIVEPNDNLADDLRRSHDVNVVGNIEGLPMELGPSLIMFAVKPQVMGTVAPPYARFTQSGTVFLSIAAGLAIAFFQDCLGQEAAVVRAMPNLPASVGRGASVLCANAHVSDDQQRLCQTLLSAVGVAHWVDDEELIHAVTGLSGSGPAYVFHMVEALAEAGRAAGLSDELADALARATITGAGELLHQSSDTPAVLRQNVTSPGGTTAAGLEVLMADEGLGELMNSVVAAATRRSRELAE